MRWLVTILVALELCGCRPAAESAASKWDRFIGWYTLPHRDRATGDLTPGPQSLIPVFKVDDTYFSACHGFEIPLKQCPEGLAWDIAGSSMVGTTFGYDGNAGNFYVRILDQNAVPHFEHDMDNQKLAKIEKPKWILDAAASPPGSNTDFAGWYKPVWLPVSILEIRDTGGQYYGRWWSEDHATLETDDDWLELTPHPNRPGFLMREKDGLYRSITFNDRLKRYELVAVDRDHPTEDGPAIRFPLARLASPQADGSAKPPADFRLGIPSAD